MSTGKRLLILAAVAVCTLALCIALGLLWLGAKASDTPDMQGYVLREVGGQIALFHAGETAPIAYYEIYTALLPEADAKELRAGVHVTGRAAASRLLEDYGA